MRVIYLFIIKIVLEVQKKKRIKTYNTILYLSVLGKLLLFTHEVYTTIKFKDGNGNMHSTENG